MNKKKMLGMLLLAGVVSTGLTPAMGMTHHVKHDNTVLLAQKSVDSNTNNNGNNNVNNGTSKNINNENKSTNNINKNVNNNTNNNQNENKSASNNQNANNNQNENNNQTMTKEQAAKLKGKTITVNNMKFSGLKTMKIAPDQQGTGFMATPGFDPNGFASSVNKQLYNYELNPANDNSAMNEAIQLHGGNPVDTCVFFQSSALRGIGQNVPDYIGYTTHLGATCC
ncbi:MAG: hypothetical protein ACRC41_13315 [Sarcina sp.]